MPAILMLLAAFGVLAIISVLLIPGEAIDDKAARGMKEGDKYNKASGLTRLQIPRNFK